MTQSSAIRPEVLFNACITYVGNDVIKNSPMAYERKAARQVFTLAQPQEVLGAPQLLRVHCTYIELPVIRVGAGPALAGPLFNLMISSLLHILY